MKKFNLTAKKCEIPQLLEIVGDSSEIDKLNKKLTLTNKSVFFQQKKANERLEYWRMRYNAEVGVNGFASDYTLDKVRELEKLISNLSESLHRCYLYHSEGKWYVPAGFWHLVNKVEDDVHLSGIKPYILDTLRDYQKESVEEMLKYKRATGVLATGLGKSLIIASICMSFVKAGKRVFIVVPTDYLVGQVYETVKQFHNSVTAAGGGRHPKLGADIFVCTAQSAIKHIGDFNCVVVDECQHVPANTWEELMGAADKCEYVYNLTATPFRTDGLDLAIHASGGPTVFERDVKWGIDNGWLTKPKVFRIIINTGKEFSDKSMATTAYKHLTGHKSVLNLVKNQIEKAVASGRKVMVIFNTLDPAHKLRKLCEKTVPFNVADANFKKPLHDFQKGESNILVATAKLISEGVNIPDASVLILLTQNSSDAITYQAVGRVLRKSEGKKDAIIIDVTTEGYKQFANASLKRLAVYSKITDEIKDMRA